MFLDGVDLGPNIARNQALKENVFMMVICIELRIPLFLVGKPGSSKSLAKTIVADAMQGEAARTRIFRLLKSVRKKLLFSYSFRLFERVIHLLTFIQVSKVDFYPFAVCGMAEGIIFLACLCIHACMHAS